MYENIRRPGLLKNIPLILIRALPATYYYGKYISNSNYQKAELLYRQSLEFLFKAITMMTDQLKHSDPSMIFTYLEELNKAPNQKIIDYVEQFTLALSEFCSSNTNDCSKFYKMHKEQLIRLYRETVTPLHILMTNTKHKEKTPHLLSNFCYYHLIESETGNHKYPDQISASDFLILTNLDSSKVHQEINRISAFKKPVMVIVSTNDTNLADKRALRHAMQLIRTGFPVIFKIVTPIRLFTTVEKTFFKYHLHNTSH